MESPPVHQYANHHRSDGLGQTVLAKLVGRIPVDLIPVIMPLRYVPVIPIAIRLGRVWPAWCYLVLHLQLLLLWHPSYQGLIRLGNGGG